MRQEEALERAVDRSEKGRSRTSSPSQDLADAAVADPELPGDVAGPDALVSHVHDALPDHLRKRASINKHST